MVVRELELDLDAFEGPFDLLLTLLLKEELEPADVDMAAIVIAFVERLAERDELDLEACGEFLVLIAALLELKARALFPDEEAELAELEPEEAAEELARRLAEYRRMKEAAAWLSERLAGERDRYFRIGPAALAPRPERKLAPRTPSSSRRRSVCSPRRRPRSRSRTWRSGSRRSPSSSSVSAPSCARAAASISTPRSARCRASTRQSRSWLCSSCARREIASSRPPLFPDQGFPSAAPSWPAAAHAVQSPAPPLPDAADVAPAGGPYSHTAPPANASPATPQEAAVESQQESANANERTAEWIVRSA